ncbi:MAG: diguanylate cyclase [Candidatus Omnitrophota bacterium]
MISGAPIPKKQLLLLFATLVSLFLTYFIIHALSYLETTIDPEVYLRRAAICLAAFLLPISAAWFAAGLLAAGIFAMYASVLSVFVAATSQLPFFMWYLAEYGGALFVLFQNDSIFRDSISVHELEREKMQNERNDLDTVYRQKGEGISIYFEKYSTYYHLRKLAEDLAASLSVSELAGQIVKKCIDLIPKGDVALISVADQQLQHLSVLASYSKKDVTPHQEKHGDLFDLWAIRNRQRLIVVDTQQDFRFDVSSAMQQEALRSLILSPLLHEGRVVGTLRIHSQTSESFMNDDLRLLDAIGTLASSALSNALLYERTEELAVRDSLTGLYVRRYFFDRLKDEHRRFLMNKRPLSMLMCDLDHFKECNDRFGHEAGDLMLVRLAEIMKEEMGDHMVARYGGEEFAVLLPEVSRAEAFKYAEKLRLKVEKTDFRIRRTEVKMTVSIGVANIPEDTIEGDSLVEKADKALYRAKAGGRNRVC